MYTNTYIHKYIHIHTYIHIHIHIHTYIHTYIHSACTEYSPVLHTVLVGEHTGGRVCGGVWEAGAYVVVSGRQCHESNVP